MKYLAKGWNPKKGHRKTEIEADGIKEAMKKAKKELKYKSGEISVTPLTGTGTAIKENE